MRLTRYVAAKRPLGILALAVVFAASCGDAPPTPAAPGTIDRETFIATYVDLRTSAVRGDTVSVTDAERTAILARHGVTEEELMAFAELNGENVDLMRAVWDEIERRLDAERVGPR